MIAIKILAIIEYLALGNRLSEKLTELNLLFCRDSSMRITQNRKGNEGFLNKLRSKEAFLGRTQTTVLTDNMVKK